MLKPWRCTALFERGRSYLVRVDRQSVDVTLEIIAPDGTSALKVDSPTRRAGPELLFYHVTARGKHTIIVGTPEHGVPDTFIGLQLRALPGAQPGTPLAGGLAALTSAAQFSDKQDPAEGQRRIAMLKGALGNLVAAGDRELEAEVLFRVAAITYWNLADWQKAANAAHESMRAFTRLNNPVMTLQAAVIRAASLIEIASAPHQSGTKPSPKASDPHLLEAAQLLEGAARTFHEASMKYDEAHAINNIGVLFHHQGKDREARARYASASRIFRELGEVSSELLPLRNIAVLDYERGDYADAVVSYERQLRLLKPEDDIRGYVALLNNLGTAHYALGDTDKALVTLMTALPLTEKQPDPSDRARTLHALGRTYLNIGDEERGAVFLEQALELRRSMAGRDRRGMLNSLLRNGDMRRERGFAQDALKLHLQALDYVVSPQERTRVLLAAGLDQMALGTVDAAIDTYERALKLELPEEWPARISVVSRYGDALMRRGDPRGRPLLEKAARAHESIGDNELAAQNYYLLASDDRRSGRYEAALQNVDKALALYESLRIRAINPDLRATYVSIRSAAFELRADLYMTLADRATTTATATADKERLRSAALFSAESIRLRALDDFRESAGSRSISSSAAAPDTLFALDDRLAAKRHRLAAEMDLQNPSADRIVSLQRDIALLRTELDVAESRRRSRGEDHKSPAQTNSIAQLQARLTADDALVTWILGAERSWIWCITRESAATFPLPPGDRVVKAAQDLQTLWSQPAYSDKTKERELQASRVILGRAGEGLRNKRAVTIVSSGALRALPVGALWITQTSDRTPQRVAETLAVSYRPSLTQWKGAQRAKDSAPMGQRILLVGDPIFIGGPDRSSATSSPAPADSLTPMDRLPVLPGTKREIASIASIAEDWRADILTGREATKAAVLAEPLAEFRVLHFATHARLDVHDPQLSALILSSSSDTWNTSESSLSLREIVQLPLSANVVVLSACESSRGKQYRSQLSFGLAEAFLFAGADSVVGGLWRVSDVATEHYMRIFYERYFRGHSTSAAAAQSAARALMQDPVHAHPFYWAAFVVVTS